jgi:heterodisulfide reductase subunit A-like polyferredoxin
LIIQVEDTLVGKQRRIPVDMVILSSGLEPRHDAKEVAHLFGISCSADGWLIEKHPKLDPVATMTEGIFIAGCVQGPKDIPPALLKGAAAAARVLGRIQQGEIALEPVRASVDEAKCSGCRICNNCARSTPSSSTKKWCQRSTRLVPGLRHLCGCVPGRSYQRHRFQQRADPFSNRRSADAEPGLGWSPS